MHLGPAASASRAPLPPPPSCAQTIKTLRGKELTGEACTPARAAHLRPACVAAALHKTVPGPSATTNPPPPHPTSPYLTLPHPAVSTELGVTTMIGSGVVTTLTSAPHKAGKATIIPIDSVLQYVNHASDDEAPDASRRLMSARTLMCSCGGMSGCESTLPRGRAGGWRARKAPVCGQEAPQAPPHAHRCAALTPHPTARVQAATRTARAAPAAPSCSATAKRLWTRPGQRVQPSWTPPPIPPPN